MSSGGQEETKAAATEVAAAEEAEGAPATAATAATMDEESGVEVVSPLAAEASSTVDPLATSSSPLGAEQLDAERPAESARSASRASQEADPGSDDRNAEALDPAHFGGRFATGQQTSTLARYRNHKLNSGSRMQVPSVPGMAPASTIKVLRSAQSMKTRKSRLHEARSLRQRIDEIKTKHEKIMTKRQLRFEPDVDGYVFGDLAWLRGCLTLSTAFTAFLASLVWIFEYNPRDLSRAFIAQSFNAFNFWLLLVHVIVSAELPNFRDKRLLFLHLFLIFFSGILRNVADLSWVDRQSTTQAVYNLISWVIMLIIIFPGMLQFQVILRRIASMRSVAIIIEQFVITATPGIVVVIYFAAEVLNCFFYGFRDELEGSCETLYYANDTLALFSVASTMLTFLLYHDSSFELIDVIRLRIEWKLMLIGLFFGVSSVISISLVAFREENLGEDGQNWVVVASYVFYVSWWVIIIMQYVRMYNHPEDYFNQILDRERLTSVSRITIAARATRSFEEDNTDEPFHPADIATIDSDVPPAPVEVQPVGIANKTSSEEEAEHALEVTVTDPYSRELVNQGARRDLRHRQRATGSRVTFSFSSATNLARLALEEEGSASNVDEEERSVRTSRTEGSADYTDVVRELFNSVATSAEKAALEKPDAGSESVFGSLFFWEVCLLLLSFVCFTLIKILGFLYLVPRTLSDACWGLSTACFIFHGIIVAERDQFPWLWLLQMMQVSLNETGVHDIQDGNVLIGGGRVFLVFLAGMIAFGILTWYERKMRREDPARARRCVAVAFVLLPTILSVNLLWTLQGSACTLSALAFECGGDADCPISSTCLGEGLACGALGYHASAMAALYVAYQTRERTKTEETEIIISLPKMANLDLPIKYLFPGTLVLMITVVTVVGYVASQAGALTEEAGEQISTLTFYGDWIAAFFFLASDSAIRRVNFVTSAIYYFCCRQVETRQEEGNDSEWDRSSQRSERRSVVSSDGRTSLDMAVAGDVEGGVLRLESTVSSKESRRSLTREEILEHAQRGLVHAKEQSYRKKQMLPETLTPIAALVLEIEMRLQSRPERIKTVGLQGKTFFGGGRGLDILAFGTVIAAGLIPSVLFTAGVTDFRLFLDTAFGVIYVLYKMATLDYAAEKNSAAMLWSILQLQKAVFLAGDVLRGRWVDAAVDAYLLVVVNPLLFVGFRDIVFRLRRVIDFHPCTVRELMNAFVSEYLFTFVLVACLSVELGGYTATDRSDSTVDDYNIKAANGATQGQLAVSILIWLLILRPSGVSLIEFFRLKLPLRETVCCALLVVGWIFSLWMLGGRLQARESGRDVFSAMYVICNASWLVLVAILFRDMDDILSKAVRYQEGPSLRNMGHGGGILTSAGSDILFT